MRSMFSVGRGGTPTHSHWYTRERPTVTLNRSHSISSGPVHLQRSSNSKQLALSLALFCMLFEFKAMQNPPSECFRV